MNILDIYQKYRVLYDDTGTHHHSTPGRVQSDCPQCSRGTGRFRLGYHLTRHTYHCWVCGSLPLVNTLMELTGESYRVIKDLVGSLERLYIPDSKHRGKLTLPEPLGILSKSHRRYLAQRGFDPDELAQTWGLQSIGLAKRLAWRIFIPVPTLEGETVSWTTRAGSDEVELRYVNAKPAQEKIPLKKLLYGLHLARQSAIVVEGPADVWAIGPGAVATMGVAYSRAQLANIANFASRAICFDNEPEAQKRARQLCRSLLAFPGETYRVQLSAKDPGCSSRSEIRELRKRFLE